jgi:hypothetical protein
MTTQRRKVKLQTLQKWQAKRDEEGSRKRRFDFWSMIVFVVALLLLVWAIEIYRSTFIDWRNLVVPTAIGAFLGIVLSWRQLANFHYPVWAILMIGIVTGSSLPYFTILYVNERFSETNETEEVFNIEKTGRLPSGRSGCGRPYAVIHFYGLNKDVLFNCDDVVRMNDYSKVRITYSNGLLGYKIIRRKVLEL